MHGGAKGSGAPRANRNARKHGRFTKDEIAERREIRALLGGGAEDVGGDEVIRYSNGLHARMRS
ncbi:hypothetical protein FBZ93_105458 [Bradyrhizobium macuxiense]|uniref:Uncharacterized protein n=2 Tax=Bradyrhizobium macuxiense TaxID=1755647 RepID=A0A560LYY1_9BRAD|nr:hypothetical protein FBZ93_105458 [Bradyrhizobium macuxiense]